MTAARMVIEFVGYLTQACKSYKLDIESPCVWCIIKSS